MLHQSLQFTKSIARTKSIAHKLSFMYANLLSSTYLINSKANTLSGRTTRRRCGESVFTYRTLTFIFALHILLETHLSLCRI